MCSSIRICKNIVTVKLDYFKCKYSVGIKYLSNTKAGNTCKGREDQGLHCHSESEPVNSGLISHQQIDDTEMGPQFSRIQNPTEVGDRICDP